VFYGSAGNASAGHLAIEYLKLATKLKLSHVPYKGTGPMLPDLLSGPHRHVRRRRPAALQHIKSGKLRVIAVGNPQRLPAFPDIPSVAEQGYPGFETSQWYGLIGPAGIPDAIVKRLSDEAAKAVRSKEVQKNSAADSAIGVGDTAGNSPRSSSRTSRWEGVVKAAGNQGGLRSCRRLPGATEPRPHVVPAPQNASR
jgi:tripartite-type tricarboxylate transporter receptor subunit TctC